MLMTPPSLLGQKTCFGYANWLMLSCSACPALPISRHHRPVRRAMPQLNLNFANLPNPLMRIWKQLDAQQQRLVIETLARILNRVSQSNKSEEHAND
jgi:hypothetical protein